MRHDKPRLILLGYWWNRCLRNYKHRSYVFDTSARGDDYEVNKDSYWIVYQTHGINTDFYWEE